MQKNVNEYVWLKLNEVGEKIHRSHQWQDAGNGWYKFQIWEFMEIFGPFMYLGSSAPFEAGMLYFEKPEGAER